MLNLTLEETKQKHKEMWTMISDVLKENSRDVLDDKFMGCVRFIKNYCLDKMGYDNVERPRPDVGCFLCDYAEKHETKEFETKFIMCPGVGKCNGYVDECLNGLYCKFCYYFEHGAYDLAQEKALEIANLKLDALDLLPFN